jgi:hypothetical protein
MTVRARFAGFQLEQEWQALQERKFKMMMDKVSVEVCARTAPGSPGARCRARRAGGELRDQGGRHAVGVPYLVCMRWLCGGGGRSPNCAGYSKGDYVNPVVSKCGHYFCEKCALQRYAKVQRAHVRASVCRRVGPSQPHTAPQDTKCAGCGEQTFGIFNTADKLVCAPPRACPPPVTTPARLPC